MVFEQKQFTEIKGYSDYYICKDTTEVLSLKKRMNTLADTPKILKQVNNSKDPRNNYYIVTLVSETGKRKNRPIHRLMCETFIPNPMSKAHVNHKDGNKLNNSIDNLEWATEAENSQHAVDTRLTTHEHCSSTVHQYNTELEFIATYCSDREASRQTGVAYQNISKVTRGLRKSAGGYFWSRTKENS